MTASVRELPILMTGAMVRAIIKPTDPKTVTRRLAKFPGKRSPRNEELDNLGDCETVVFRGKHYVKCPYGGEHDRLWVRETWAEVCDLGDGQLTVLQPTSPETRAAMRKVIFRATAKVPADVPVKWKPGIHLRRVDARIVLERTEWPTIERVQEITEDDAIAEGITRHDGLGVGHSGFRYSEDSDVYGSARDAYAALWTSINGAGSWAKNPLVWVVRFRLHEKK